MSHRRRLIAALAGGSALLLLAAPVGAQDAQTYSGTLGELNGSGASGDFTIEVTGTTAEVTVNTSGMVDLVHAQHLHGEVGTENACPDIGLDSDGDGLLSTAEGVPGYGSVKVSLTTEGDSSPDSALAVDRFPTGDTYTYTQTIELPEDIAANLTSMNLVVHGIDLDGSGEYDGDAVSSLDETLPLEATIPALCGRVVAAAATPTGGVATGAGGTADAGNGGGLLVGLAVATGLGAVALRRRPTSAA